MNSVRMLGQSPEVIGKTYNFNRACIYRWLKQYDEGGFTALESDMPPGAELLVTSEMDVWLKQVVLNQNPVDFGYDTHLWTCLILAELLKNKFDVTVSDSTVRLHLKSVGLTFQKPEYQDIERDEQEIDYFLTNKFPRIQRLAESLTLTSDFRMRLE